MSIYKVELVEEYGESYFVDVSSEDEAEEIIEKAYWNNELFIDGFRKYRIVARRMPDEGDYELFNDPITE